MPPEGTARTLGVLGGTRFQKILRGGLAYGQYPDARGREEEWLAEQLRQHPRPPARAGNLKQSVE